MTSDYVITARIHSKCNLAVLNLPPPAPKMALLRVYMTAASGTDAMSLDQTTSKDVQESPAKTSESSGLTQVVEDAYKSVAKAASSAADTLSLVKSGDLPNLDVSAHPDEKVALVTGTKTPDSHAIKEAKETIVSKEASQEEKLKAAYEMAKAGEKSFVGPDGRKYEISVGGGKNHDVAIFTNDKNGDSHPVLRGTVGDDGKIGKQRGSDGKEVSYEGTWAKSHLKDSPLMGSKEKADAYEPSAENKHLQQTLKDKGLEPKNQTDAERFKLDAEHGKLVGDVKSAQGKYDAEKKEADAKNKPLEREIARLQAEDDKLGSTDAAREVGKANGKLAEDMKAAGISDGKTLDVSKPESIKEARKAIAEKEGLSADDKKKLNEDVDKLEKAVKHSNEVDKKSEKLQDQITKLYDKIEQNKEPVKEAGKHLTEAKAELRKNEEKISEAKFSEDLKEIDKLPEAKREAVYKAMEKIANDSGGAPNHLSPEQRQKLVEQMAHQIAHPESIQQGNKGTCGLACTEFVLASKYPEKYASMMADLATKGETTTADGKTMKVSPDLINTTNKKGEMVAHDDGNPDRTLASKIFQSAAANRVLENEALSKTPPEKPPTYDTQRPGTKYPIEVAEVDPTKATDFRPSEDTGERIVAADGTVTHWTGVTNEDIAKLTSDITGEKYEAVKIVQGRDMKDPKQEAAAEKDFIETAEKSGLPVKTSITTMKGDFSGMNAEGGHEVIVTRIDKGPPAMVYYDNTAGGADHNYPTGKPVPLSDFLKSMSETKMSDGNTHVEGYIIAKKK